MKIELTNRGLGTQGTKEVLLNRLLKAIQDMDTRNTESESRNKANEMEKITSNISDASVSIELVKEIFTNMFKEQEEKLLNIVRNGISDTNARLDRLTQEISDNNVKLNDLSKETDVFKLSIEISQEITGKKFKEINKKLKNDKQQHGNKIDELWQENEYLREKLRDIEDRSQCDNLRIDGLQEVENETWEQTEKILKSMIQEKLEIEDVNIERAHRVGNTSNTSPRTVVAKFSSFKGKQLVLSAAKKLKGQNIYINEDFSKETMDIRKEKWKSVKSLRSQGKYAVLFWYMTKLLSKVILENDDYYFCLLLFWKNYIHEET